jgi:hypothetical protein
VGRVVADRTDHNRDDDDGEDNQRGGATEGLLDGGVKVAREVAEHTTAMPQTSLPAALKVRNLGVRHTCGAGEGGHGGAEERDEPAKEDRGSAAPL